MYVLTLFSMLSARRVVSVGVSAQRWKGSRVSGKMRRFVSFTRATILLLSIKFLTPHAFHSTPKRLHSYVRTPGSVGSLRAGAATEGAALLQDFLRIFDGKFDNEQQAREDEREGRTWEGADGHEHITCELCSITAADGMDAEEMIVATYSYVRDAGQEVFRYRWYTLTVEEQKVDSVLALRMRVHRLLPWAEAVMKDGAYSIRPDALQEKGEGKTPWEYLPECDVIWRRDGQAKDGSGVVFRGELAAGECLVPSQRDPTRMLRVTDDLRISTRHLHINDQVQDSETGKILYGKSSPYLLLRVT